MLTLKACLSMLACVFTCKYKACSTVKACYLVVTTNIPVNSVDRRLERRITVSWGMMSHFWVMIPSDLREHVAFILKGSTLMDLPLSTVQAPGSCEMLGSTYPVTQLHLPGN